MATATKLEEAVRNNPTATVIYQIFDSSIYFASSAPGEQVLPRRGVDGKHHVCGELVLANWTAFKKIFYAAVPLLRAGGDNKKIILSPLPRYSTNKCCSDEKHITNYGSTGYGTSMGAALADIHSWTDDFACWKRIKNFEVVCPGTTIWEDKGKSTKALKMYWGSDPVHLTPKGYEELAEKLNDKVAASHSKKRERSGSNTGNPPLRARLDHTHCLTGISSSDTMAKRYDLNSGHGGRGGRHQKARKAGGGGKGQPK